MALATTATRHGGGELRPWWKMELGDGNSGASKEEAAGAHRENDEVVSEVGGVFGATNRAAAIAGRGDEDGGDGVASGHPASRASW